MKWDLLVRSEVGVVRLKTRFENNLKITFLCGFARTGCHFVHDDFFRGQQRKTKFSHRSAILRVSYFTDTTFYILTIENVT